MNVFDLIYKGLSYVIMFPWVCVKGFAFVVFITCLSVLALLYMLITWDVSGIYLLYKYHLNKELKLLWNAH